MADLIVDSALEKNSHHDEEESRYSNGDDPGKTVLTEARNESEGRSEEDDKPDCDVNPCRVNVNG